MPIIGVKRANSELDYQSPVKKSSPAPGIWTRFTGLVSRLFSYLNQPDGDSHPQPLSSDNSVKLMEKQNDDALIVPPYIRPLYTPVLSELERNEKCDVTTPTSLRQPRSLLFTPLLFSNSSKHHKSLATSCPSNKQPLSSTIISQRPSTDHFSKSPVLTSSRFASKPRSFLMDQSTSVGRSRNQLKSTSQSRTVDWSRSVDQSRTVDWSRPVDQSSSLDQSKSVDQSRSMDRSRLGNQSTFSSHSKSKDLSMSKNHSPVFPVLHTPLLTSTANSHTCSNHSRVTPQRTTPITSNHSPIGEFQQWINDFKDSYHSNRRDLVAQIDAAEKYAQLQSDQRNQLCDQRMEQLRKRFDSGLDINELLMDDGVEQQQAEMRLQHDNKEQASIQRAFGPGAADEELSCAYRIRLKRRDIQTLYGMHWLNDEVVNFYMSMIADTCSDVHSYSSFFYPKLISNAGYSGVRRWTKKVDIFSKRLLLVPVHLGMHWCLAAVDFNNKLISYYDSLKGHNPECLQALKQYLVQEAADKKQMVYDMSAWQCITHKNIPGQQNGSDCGVFMCMYARHLARNKPFSFSQDDMPIIREHMVLEMLEQKLI